MGVPRSISYGYLRPPDRLSTFHATLLREDDEHIVLTHSVHDSRPMLRGGRAVLVDGSPIIWFLFRDQPYDVGRFHLPDGTFTGYYVDIIEPVSWGADGAASLQTVTDLFLDIWIAPDGDAEVLDEDELRAAVEAGWISKAQADRARGACATVLAEITAGRFPPTFVREWPALSACPSP
jgi:predicted RNA-binding protein associated with RNAse of E/G family